MALLSPYASRYIPPEHNCCRTTVRPQPCCCIVTMATPAPDLMSVCQEDILSIWNRTSNDQMTTSRIRDTLRRVLNLPTNTIMEYKTHNDSLRYDWSPPEGARLNTSGFFSINIYEYESTTTPDWIQCRL